MRSDLLGFAVLAALVTLSPGADFALVTRRALTSGTRAAMVTSAGICTGLLVWAVLSAVGVAALLAASAPAYSVLKVAGAVYLVLLGALALVRAGRHVRGREAEGEPEVPAARGTAFGQGLLTNLLNPKVAVLYSAVLPQFVSPTDPVLAVSLAFAAMHAAMGMVWLGTCAWLVHRGAARLRRPGVRAALEALTGAALVGIGLRVALDRR